MKTLKILKRKAWFGSVYLLIAIGFFVAYLYQGPFLELFERESFTFKIVVFFGGGALYLMHFFYASIYFPQRYKGIILKKVFPIDLVDTSSIRSVVTFLLTLFIFGIEIYSSSENFYKDLFLLFLFALLNVFLWQKTRTDKLFKADSIQVDMRELFPYAKEHFSKDPFKVIGYWFPVNDPDENSFWCKMAIKKEVKKELSKLKEKKHESDMRKIATKQSKEFYEKHLPN